MARTIKVAALQMDAAPAPTPERLDRAESLIARAAEAGAQLVVLPEIFNTGYTYADDNYGRAEPIDGRTCVWMRKSAERFGVHLAGSLMLLEQGEIYNALLLFDPAGKMWRYDKNYPWAWERGYYRGRRGRTVAHTALGDLGMMICWDVGHPRLWKDYAGEVDMMVVASCPPDGTSPTYHFPDGGRVGAEDLGPVMASMKGTGRHAFGDMFNQQAAWLGVPAVNTGGSGRLQTSIPRGVAFAWGLSLMAPWFGRRLPQAGRMQMSCDMIPSCKIVDGEGRVLAERTQAEGEGFTLAEVELRDTRALPRGPQPKSPLAWAAYFSSDVLVPFLMKSVYRKGLRRLS